MDDEVAAAVDEIFTHGITARRGAFTVDWVAEMREDIDAPGAGHDALHDTMATRDYWATLAEEVRRHMHCRVVDELVPIVQKHQIDGLIHPEY